MKSLGDLFFVMCLDHFSQTFPAAAHRAIVTPLINKASVDKEVLKNYCPVSNLCFVVKVIEKSAATQLVEHLNTNSFQIHLSLHTAFSIALKPP